MTGARIAQLSRSAMVDAIPDREIEMILSLHGESLVQRRQYSLGYAKVGVHQRARTESIGHCYRQQRGADAVAAYVEQINGEVFGIDPVITERISSQFSRRNEPPINSEGFRNRPRQNRKNIALGIAQLLLQPFVCSHKRFA